MDGGVGGGVEGEGEGGEGEGGSFQDGEKNNEDGKVLRTASRRFAGSWTLIVHRAQKFGFTFSGVGNQWHSTIF